MSDDSIELVDASGDRAILEARDAEGGYVAMLPDGEPHFMGWRQIIATFDVAEAER